jgi:hypothetical protein
MLGKHQGFARDAVAQGARAAAWGGTAAGEIGDGFILQRCSATALAAYGDR